MQPDSLALLVIAMIVLALFVLVAFAIHRLANSNAKRIVAVIVALTVLLGAIPALVTAFHAFAS